MKSLTGFILVTAICSSTAFAETTLELIKQRAESGDATAQTLMGLMAFYGYQVPRDANMSESWFQQAADQGDSYASERVVMAQKKRSYASSSTNSVKWSSSGSSTNHVKSKAMTLMFLSKEELEKKVSSASSAKYAGSIDDIDKMVLNRSDYVGKVIEVRFSVSSLRTTSGENPYLYIRGIDNYNSISSEQLMLCGQDALKWAVNISKQGFGATGKVYALVEPQGFVALGVRKSKVDDGYTYSW